MRDDESGWIGLHPGELYFVWRELECGELPTSLGIPHVGRTSRTRAELARTVSESLRERGLGTVDEPAPDLVALLHTFVDSDLRFDVEIDGVGDSFRAVTGRRGDTAVSIGVSGGEVRLGPVRDTAMIAGLFDTLSPLPVARGWTANLRLTDFREACAVGESEGPAGFNDVLRSAGLRPPEVQTLSRAVGERTGGGQFGGSVYTDGDWQRVNNVLSWVDTAVTRYVLRSDDEWLTVTPVDVAQLRSMAHELAATL